MILCYYHGRPIRLQSTFVSFALQPNRCPPLRSRRSLRPLPCRNRSRNRRARGNPRKQRVCSRDWKTGIDIVVICRCVAVVFLQAVSRRVLPPSAVLPRKTRRRVSCGLCLVFYSVLLMSVLHRRRRYRYTVRSFICKRCTLHGSSVSSLAALSASSRSERGDSSDGTLARFLSNLRCTWLEPSLLLCAAADEAAEEKPKKCKFRSHYVLRHSSSQLTTLSHSPVVIFAASNVISDNYSHHKTQIYKALCT